MKKRMISSPNDRLDPHLVGPQIKSLGNLVMRFLESESSAEGFDDATCSNGWILRYLRQNEGRDVYQKDLEKEFCITRSTASKVITLMEQKGYIVRRTVEGDGRLRRLELTEKANQLMEHRRRTGNKAEKTLTAGLSEAEVEEFFRITNKMKENMLSAVEK